MRYFSRLKILFNFPLFDPRSLCQKRKDYVPHHGLEKTLIRQLGSRKSCKDDENEDACSKNKNNYKIPKEVEDQFNHQIINELFASHTYLSLATFFARTEVSLFGFSGYFLEMSGEEREHAFMLMQFLNNRGGMVKLECIEKPPEITVPKNKAVCAALDAAIALEEQNTKSLRELAALAEKCKDELTVDFIVTQYLYEQMESLQLLQSTKAKLMLCQDCGVGIFLLDREIAKGWRITSEKSIFINPFTRRCKKTESLACAPVD